MKVLSCLSGGMFIALALGGTSCSTPDSAAAGAASGQYYVVAAKDAEFYRYGPQQANGPDERLPQGTLVSLLRASFGYSKVQLMNGAQGYVASQDIHVAPADVVQAAINPPVESSGTTRGHESGSSHQPRFRYDIVDPRFQPPPEPLPVDIPEPSPDTSPSPTP